MPRLELDLWELLAVLWAAAGSQAGLPPAPSRWVAMREVMRGAENSLLEAPLVQHCPAVRKPVWAQEVDSKQPTHPRPRSRQPPLPQPHRSAFCWALLPREPFAHVPFVRFGLAAR